MSVREMLMRTVLTAAIAIAVVGCSPSPTNNNDPPDAGRDVQSDVPADSPTDAPTDLPQDESWKSVGWLLHVNGRSETDIYVVGGKPSEGRLRHFDGVNWTDDPIPEGTPLLNWIHVFDDGQAVAVGAKGTVLWHDEGQWSAEASGTEQMLWGVWGSSPDDVWAVGGRGAGASSQATALRRIEGAWEEVALPALDPGVVALFKVWGSGADDVYIVGQSGTVLHFGGADLSSIDVGATEDLISLAGSGPDNVILVGGRSNGVVARFDGVDWTTQSISPAPGVNGIWMVSPTQAWLAGARGLLRPCELLEDGSVSVERTAPVSELDLHAVASFDNFGQIAVGGNFSRPQGPWEGVFVHQEAP